MGLLQRTPEKAMATHSSTLAWKIPWTEEPVGCRLWGRTESDTAEATQQQQQGQRSIFYNFFVEEVDIGNHILRVEDVNISLLSVLVAYLYRQAKQATITLMPRMIQIVTSNDVNPILLRPVLRIVLATDGVAHVIAVVWLSYSQLFPLMTVTLSVKQFRHVYQLLKL